MKLLGDVAAPRGKLILQGVLGLIAGTAVFFWAFGAWLIRESWVALAAWVTTFAAMLISIWRTLATGG